MRTSHIPKIFLDKIMILCKWSFGLNLRTESFIYIQQYITIIYTPPQRQKPCSLSPPLFLQPPNTPAPKEQTKQQKNYALIIPLVTFHCSIMQHIGRAVSCY